MFELYTEKARRVIFFARCQRRRDSNWRAAENNPRRDRDEASAGRADFTNPGNGGVRLPLEVDCRVSRPVPAMSAFQRGAGLMAQRFNVRKAEVFGDPMLLEEGQSLG